MNSSLGLDAPCDIAERAVMVPEASTQAYSGARFERLVLADGRRLVCKRLPPEGDWLTRLTHGAERARLLWDSGILARVAVTVDHATVAVVRSHGADVFVMRDVGEFLIPPGQPVSSTLVAQLLHGLGGLHQAWEGQQIESLCPIEARYRLFAPRWHASDCGPNPHPARDVIMSGWEAFAELVPTTIAEAVFAVHEDPEPLATALMAAAPATLLHGDFKLWNLGLNGDRLVAIDWGELTGIGPAEVDVAWFALLGGLHFDGTPDDVFAAYDAQASRHLEPAALDLACIGSLAQLGFKLAALCRASHEPTHARAAVLLAWWVNRFDEALRTWSPM